MAKPPTLLFATLVLCAIALVACSSSSEEEIEKTIVFDLSIEGGELDIEDGIIRVRQGDNIILRVDSDEQGILHLHGYDIEQEVGPDGSADIEVVADTTGRSSITFHPGGGGGVDSQKEINLGALEVRPR